MNKWSFSLTETSGWRHLNNKTRASGCFRHDELCCFLSAEKEIQSLSAGCEANGKFAAIDGRRNKPSVSCSRFIWVTREAACSLCFRWKGNQLSACVAANLFGRRCRRCCRPFNLRRPADTSRSPLFLTFQSNTWFIDTNLREVFRIQTKLGKLLSVPKKRLVVTCGLQMHLF